MLELQHFTVEGTIQLQEGELTVFELILNLDSIVGTFVTGNQYLVLIIKMLMLQLQDHSSDHH